MFTVYRSIFGLKWSGIRGLLEFLPSLKTRNSLQSAAYLSGKYQTNNCSTVSRPLLWISVVLFPLCRCYLGFDSISCCSHYIIPCFTSKPLSANAGNRLVHVWTSLLQYQKVVPRVISALATTVSQLTSTDTRWKPLSFPRAFCSLVCFIRQG